MAQRAARHVAAQRSAAQQAHLEEGHRLGEAVERVQRAALLVHLLGLRDAGSRAVASRVGAQGGKQGGSKQGVESGAGVQPRGRVGGPGARGSKQADTHPEACSACAPGAPPCTAGRPHFPGTVGP